MKYEETLADFSFIGVARISDAETQQPHGRLVLYAKTSRFTLGDRAS